MSSRPCAQASFSSLCSSSINSYLDTFAVKHSASDWELVKTVAEQYFLFDDHFTRVGQDLIEVTSSVLHVIHTLS